MSRGSREGTEPRCPFCGAKLERPADMTISPVEKAQGGRCACDAFFIVDSTGKNVGEVMAQALGMAAEKLSKNIWDLAPDDDYEEAIMRYDFRTHRSLGFDRGYADGYGRLYIIKIKKNRLSPVPETETV